MNYCKITLTIPYELTSKGLGKVVAIYEQVQLLIEANMEKVDWLQWIVSFMRIATEQLGFEVKNAED